MYEDDFVKQIHGIIETSTGTEGLLLKAFLSHYCEMVKLGMPPITFAPSINIDQKGQSIVEHFTKEFHITGLNRKCLVALAANANRILTKEQIAKYMWNDFSTDESRYVSVRICIGELRKLIQSNKEISRKYEIVTYHGTGYMLEIF